MPRTSTYLNFPRSTEEAFLFYKSVFGTEFSAPIARFKDMPAQACPPGQPPLPPADQNLVIHIELPILGGHVLMGTDAPESMGFTVTNGNNVFINLEPDTRAETDRLFKALSGGGTVEMPLQEMFWGGYFGTIIDRFGTRWMFNCASKK
ncbi:MAG: 3-demethylubiquinone-9 3-methyltransferase [Verrucomicrobia bacterium]|nr:3-demethylubiquinone-9 3-methyltransferase [Verrucomicrobiota bacterium]